MLTMSDTGKKRFQRRIQRCFGVFTRYPTVKAIESAFVLLFPVVLIGSTAMLFRSLPVAPYQSFIKGFGGGVIDAFLMLLYNGTFGIFSFYIVAAIAYCCAQEKTKESNQWPGAAVTAVFCFAVMTQFDGRRLVGDVSAFGSFTAIVCAILSNKFYFWIKSKRHGNVSRLYSDGADLAFNNSLSVLLPTVATVSVFAVASLIVTRLFNADSLQALFVSLMELLFRPLSGSFFSGLLYVFLSTLMWFFGLHGTNILESVAQTQFLSTEQVSTALAAGAPHTEIILTRSFLNTFIPLGGCGATICLLIAILIFSKRRGNRMLAKVSLVPGLFNINELTIFGLPVILNPILILPFLAAPLAIFCVSYFAMWTGLVPPVIDYVEWTTPPIISGYLATGSISGGILQLVCIVMGVFIYSPFIYLMDKSKKEAAKKQMDALLEVFKEGEEYNKDVNLVGSHGINGETAKVLAADLKNAIKKNEPQLYYQPQFDNNNRCIGAEALLRWDHPVYGMLYPPLVIRIAAETGQLSTLEKYIFNRAASELSLGEKSGHAFPKLSINVSVSTLFQPDFVDFLRGLTETYKIAKGTLCIEITEQMALTGQGEIETRFKALKELGFLLALDDFSMGHTSLKYLQRGQFDIVKLDGNLVQGMLENARCKDIISSIVYLSNSLGFSIVAEFVETRNQQEELDQIGCVNYQGYLYSPAVTLEKYEELLRKQNEHNENQ